MWVILLPLPHNAQHSTTVYVQVAVLKAEIFSNYWITVACHHPNCHVSTCIYQYNNIEVCIG